jgi:hypothetical protein
MSESKSLLARLLSKENISVQHGNYTTAFFDVQNRVLGLPLWKNDDKDLHDMLVGHEVGHALYTPAEGWVDMQSAANDDRVPGDYLNVVEDIRIERKIQETYPGIVRSFKKGYSYLSESDFFGLNGRDVNSMGLMDRINLKAKLRDLIDVEFSDLERPLVNKAFAADTWDEVVEAARELYQFVRQNPDSQPQDENGNSDKPTDGDSQRQEEQQQQTDGPIDPSVGDDDNQQEQEESTNDENNDSQDTGDGSQDEVSNSSDASESRADSDSEESVKDPSAGDGLDEVETYRNATENAEDLLEKNDSGGLPVVVRGLTRAQINDIIVPFEKIRQSRERAYGRFIERLDAAVANEDSPYANEDWKKYHIDKANTDVEYKEFVTETKRVVNVMAKEFELRKAAYQYSRASTARSGALDLERLHEYRTSDDIFRRVTTLADAKSHGMVMLIDNSASMHEARGSVISQVLSLAMFCKRVNIPFDVYSFTSPRFNSSHYSISDGELSQDSISHTAALMTHVLSSSFSRRQYDVAYRQLFDLSCGHDCYESRYDAMGGTPLNDILTGMHVLLKDFKRRHQIQRTIFTVLTDGDSNMLSVSRSVQSSAMKENRSGLRIIMDETSRICRPKSRTLYDTSRITKYLLNTIREEVPGLVNLGYFVATDNSDFKRAVCRATHPEDPMESVRLARKQANQNKFVSYDNVQGYDRYFVLRSFNSRDLNATDDEFEVSDRAKRAEITRAFKKYAKSKKGNRVLATQFAEIIS